MRPDHMEANHVGFDLELRDRAGDRSLRQTDAVGSIEELATATAQKLEGEQRLEVAS